MRTAAGVTLLVCLLSFPFPALAQVGLNKIAGPRIVTLADLTIAGRTQPVFVLANPCGAGESAVTFWLAVRNLGGTTSPAINDARAVWVQDSANSGWAAGAMLPAIPPGGIVPVNVTLLGLNDPAKMAGHHVFNVTVDSARSVAEQSYANNSMTVPIDFPPAFCAPPVKVAKTIVANAPTHGSGTPPYAQLHQLPTALPAPANLTNTITQGVCASHGGPAASLACSIGLPAGKLVLVWDYPFPNAVDGFRIYETAAPSGNRFAIQHINPGPVAVQSVPGVHLMVLDPPAPGSCFAVTAFHGSEESSRSATSFCVSANEVPKTRTFLAQSVGAAVTDVYVDPSKSVVDNDYANKNPFVRDLLSLTIGYTHTASLFRDQAHTQVSQYTNSLFRGYVYFNIGTIAGRHVAKAVLNLTGGSSPGTTCVSQYGSADHVWHPGNTLNISRSLSGNSPIQGPDLHLDVTPVVQSWADSPNSNTGFALEPDVSYDIYHLVSISGTCMTSFKTVTLDVTYF